MKRLAILGAMLALAVSAGTALATPPSGVTAVVLARGTNQTAQVLAGAANTDAFTIQITLAPGATTGWHSHPGATTVVVTAGTLSYWRTPDCLKRTLDAGDSINLSDAAISPGGPTGLDLARNEGTVPVTVFVTAVNVPIGATNLLQPVSSTPCTLAPQEFAPSATGITAVPIARGTLASGVNVSVAAETDILNQTVTIAPGGSTGWHGHPGTTIVAVSAGTGTFVHSDCTTTTYTAGSAFIDTPGTVHNFRNDGTVPLIVHATYVNVPVASVFRLDREAPACAGGAAAPAASALPNTATLGEAALAALPLLGAAILASSGIAVGLGWVERRRRQTR